MPGAGSGTAHPNPIGQAFLPQDVSEDYFGHRGTADVPGADEADAEHPASVHLPSLSHSALACASGRRGASLSTLRQSDAHHEVTPVTMGFGETRPIRERSWASWPNEVPDDCADTSDRFTAPVRN
jgi:hypothetical protein